MTSRTTFWAAFCGAFMALSTCFAQTPVNRKHTETLLAPLPRETRDSTIVSPDARHIAYISKADGQQTAVFDGKAETPYEQVAAVTFSPNSQWRAYAAKTGPQWQVVVNGRPQPAFSRVGPPVFSPNSKRIAYTALLADGEHAAVAEVPGQPGKPYERVFEGQLAFSNDGAYLAYGARRDGKWYIVVNGREFGPYEFLGAASGLKFSPDGKRLAFAALVAKKWHVVLVDTNAEKDAGSPAMLSPYDNIADIVFSFDSQRLAYTAQANQKWRVLVSPLPSSRASHSDSAPAVQEHDAFDAVGENTLIFAPNSYTTAYAARAGETWLVVAGRQAWKPFETIGQMLFSPDGKRLAAIAISGSSQRVLLNNREQRLFDRVGGGTLVFSPNGAKLAYIARSGRATFAVVDGERQARYDMAGYLTFTPDGRVVYAATRGDKAFTVVDEKEAAHRYDEIWTTPDARMPFDGPTQFHYLGLKAGNIYLVEEQIQ